MADQRLFVSEMLKGWKRQRMILEIRITHQCKRCPDYQVWLKSKLYIKNYGGFGGMGGEAGRGGLAGLGPLRDGRNGIRGSHGEEGVAGKNGIVTFTRN